MNPIAKATVFLWASCVLAQSDRSISVQTESARPHGDTLDGAASPHLLISGNRISATAKLSVLVMLAYDLGGDEIIAGPAAPVFWDTGYFDVSATSNGGMPSLAEAHQMLRQILADRFRLKAHWEVEQIPGFELKVRQSGAPRLIESAPDTLAYGRAVREGVVTHVSATKRSMAELALLLSAFIGQPVADRTNLKGTYDFTLDLKAFGSGLDDNSEAPIRAALEEQLGLTLIPSKTETQKLIVDYAAVPNY